MATAGRGAFILLEGVDRAGKTTQARMLVQHLQVRPPSPRPSRPSRAPDAAGAGLAASRAAVSGEERASASREAGDRRGGDRVQRRAGLRGVRPATNGRKGGWHGEEVPSLRRLQAKEGARPGGRVPRGSARNPNSDPN